MIHVERKTQVVNFDEDVATVPGVVKYANKGILKRDLPESLETSNPYEISESLTISAHSFENHKWHCSRVHTNTGA